MYRAGKNPWFRMVKTKTSAVLTVHLHRWHPEEADNPRQRSCLPVPNKIPGGGFQPGHGHGDDELSIQGLCGDRKY